MKTCSICKEEKDFAEFHKRAAAVDGYQSWCKSCKKATDLKRRERPEVREKQIDDNKKQRIKSRQLLYDYMTNKSCITCGESHRACLQFDHRDGVDKRFNIAEGVGRFSWENILLEIDKCDILCANCHHKRTAIQFGWYKGLE